MVISKCVPLAISRKQFSQFEINTVPHEMVFVGYKSIDGKKVNVKMGYEFIKNDIIQYINENGGLADDDKGKLGIYTISVTDFDENGNPIRVPIQEGGTWDQENQTNFINVENKLALIEINAGGQYIEDYVYIYDPIDGSISHVVVDNTGLPCEGSEEVIEPVEDFTLYYGGVDNCYPILTVPPMHRGVVQILHSKSMDMDFILHSSCSEVPDKKSKFIKDAQNDSDITNIRPIDKSSEIDRNLDKFYINMEEEKGFLEFPTGDAYEYTFIFSSPELGSLSHIIIDNTGDHYYNHPVKIRYGKIIDQNNNGIQDDDDLEICYDITTIDNEICILEIFHSLSADIVVKITKM